MENDLKVYHLRAEPYSIKPYWYTWCRWVAHNSAIASPMDLGTKRICNRCCPRPDLLDQWVENYWHGA